MTESQAVEAVWTANYATQLLIVPELQEWLDDSGNWIPSLVAAMMSYADVDTEEKSWNRLIIRTSMAERDVRNASRFSAFQHAVRTSEWAFSVNMTFPGLQVFNEPTVSVGGSVDAEVSVYGSMFDRQVKWNEGSSYFDTDPRRVILSDFFSPRALSVIKPFDGYSLADYFRHGLI